MNTVWIALIISHGFLGFNVNVKVKAYKTEKECNEAIEKGKIGQCTSVDYLLIDTYKK